MNDDSTEWWGLNPDNLLTDIKSAMNSMMNAPLAGPTRLIYDPISFKHYHIYTYGGPGCDCDWCWVVFDEQEFVDAWEDDYASIPDRTIPETSNVDVIQWVLKLIDHSAMPVEDSCPTATNGALTVGILWGPMENQILGTRKATQSAST